MNNTISFELLKNDHTQTEKNQVSLVLIESFNCVGIPFMNNKTTDLQSWPYVQER